MPPRPIRCIVQHVVYYDTPRGATHGGRATARAEGVTEPSGRAQIRAELDGLIAHLYGLTEEEFACILTTFPLVPDPVKIAAHNARINALNNSKAKAPEEQPQEPVPK